MVIKGLPSTYSIFDKLVFVMEIRITYGSDLIG